MPVSPEDSVKKEVLYPDDLPGMELTIDVYEYFDSDEDDESLPDGAHYGLWLPVKDVGNDRLWASAPLGLREALLEAGVDEGTTFRVVEITKGPAEHDPYEAEVELVE